MIARTSYYVRSGMAAMAVLSLLAGLPPVLVAEDLGAVAPPQKGMLLLRNGQVIEGPISRVGDVYHVAVPHGEIRISARDVEHRCGSLEEGYWQKRAAIHLGDVSDHLRLAHWCRRHGLLGHAGRELADAIALDPTHPMIEVLERRLRLDLAPPAEPTEATEAVDRIASGEQLDQLLDRMPPGSVEVFTRAVQPILINHCAAAACHGPGSKSEFRLLRPSPGRPASRRVTQRNLQAVLRWTDRQEPAASRLLSVATEPHGTVRGAVFRERQIDQYHRVAEWVKQLAEQVDSEPAANDSVARSAEKRASQGAAGEHREPDPAAAQATPASFQKLAAEAETLRASLLFDTGPQRGRPPQRFVPADPFDPEIFNRRYFGPNPGRNW